MQCVKVHIARAGKNEGGKTRMTGGDVPSFAGSIKRVESAWIDYNGHMNMAYYSLLFDRTVEEIFIANGLGPAYRARTGCSFFILVSQIHYLREVHEGDPLGMTFRVLDHDAKRVHVFMEMYHAEKGYRAATMEGLDIHIDMTHRRSAPMPDDVRGMFARLQARDAHRPWPEEAGAKIGIRRGAG